MSNRPRTRTRSDADPAKPASVTELVAAFREVVAARREAQLRCARLLAQLGDERLGEAYDRENVGDGENVGELGERHGLTAIEARALLDLSRASVSPPTSPTRSAPAPSRSRPPSASPES